MSCRKPEVEAEVGVSWVVTEETGLDGNPGERWCGESRTR
jgi:hypothetical protein